MSYTGPVDPFDLLAASVEAARGKGYVVTGWHFTEDECGYCGWLYLTDGDTEIPLWQNAKLEPTILQAARACLSRALELPEMVPVGES